MLIQVKRIETHSSTKLTEAIETKRLQTDSTNEELRKGKEIRLIYPQMS